MHKEAVSADDKLYYSDFVDVKDSFEMTILDYAPGCNCGGRACASMAIGCKNSGDTFQVFSLCNTDTSFHIHQRVMVIPEERPSFSVSIPVFIMDSKAQTQKRHLKTLYGKLVKVKSF